MAESDGLSTRRGVAMRILGFTPPMPEEMPTRTIRIIRGDEVELRQVPYIVRDYRPVRRNRIQCCCGYHGRERRD